MSLPPATIEESVPLIDLTLRVDKLEDRYFDYGGFSEIYRGRMDSTTDAPRSVAIKVLRGVHTNPKTLEKTTRYVYRESRVWHTLNHPNILEFLGICKYPGFAPSLVSPLCEEGQIMGYLGRRPEADRAKMILQIAKGLEYLHSRKVVHGDMKPSNVLVGGGGRPLICDFGRAKILEQSGFTMTAFAGAMRYMAPELLGTEEDDETDFKPTPTKETDVYGFGMVGLEILTGKMPFYPTNDFRLPPKIRKGLPKNLEYPAKYTPTWKVIERCWAKEPETRPTMRKVVLDLTPNRN